MTAFTNRILAKRILGWIATTALLLTPLAPALAQSKPVLIVSITPTDEVLADIQYGAKVTGMDASPILFPAAALLEGVDRTRPIGMYLTPKPGGGDFEGMLFIPVTDFKKVLEKIKGALGEPKDAGDGVKELATPVGQPVFFKEQKGWVFISQKKDGLANPSADPAAVLGTLPKEYTLAVRALVQNIPADLKSLAVQTIKEAMENGLKQGGGAQDRELAEKMARNTLAGLEKMVNELDSITLGLNIDQPGQKVYLDLSITAVEGSSLAKQFAQQAEVKSAFGGFLSPGAAATLNIASQLSPDDIEQTKGLITGFQKKAMEDIGKDPNLPADKKPVVKELVNSLIGVLTKTIEAGKLDVGASLLLEPKSLGFVIGGLVADGAEIEKTFKRMAELAKADPNAPKIQLDSGSHGGIQFHTLTKPIPEHEKQAREMLGEELTIILGVGQQSFYVSFGKNAESLLKSVIDKSAADGAKAVLPMQLNVSLLPLLKFAASMDDNPIVGQLIPILEKSQKDKVAFFAQPIPRGQTIRVQLDEGVVQAIGEAAKKVTGERGR